MAKKSTKQFILIFFLVLAQTVWFSGCKEHYFYLEKVKGFKRNGTATVVLNNKSPELINQAFQSELYTHIQKRLNKEGFRITDKNPQFEVVIDILVDSSLNHGLAYVSNMPSAGSSRLIDYSGRYPYSKVSKYILLNLEVKRLKTNSIVWQDQFDLYFFNSEKRDLFRTKGVVKFMLDQFSDSQ